MNITATGISSPIKKPPASIIHGFGSTGVLYVKLGSIIRATGEVEANAIAASSLLCKRSKYSSSLISCQQGY